MNPFYKVLSATLLAFSGFMACAQAVGGSAQPQLAASRAATQPGPTVVSARKAGRMWEAYVKDGQHVTQGQTMFKIATQSNSNAHPNHQMNYDVARQQYIRTLALHKAGKANAEDVAAAKFQLKMAGTVLHDAPQEVQFHYVDAPISGTLSQVTSQNKVQASTVLTIITPDPAPRPRLMAVAK